MRFPFIPVTDFEDSTQNFEALQALDILDLTAEGVLQLAVPGTTLKIALGSGTWTWPGASTTSGLATVTHGLGTTPQRVFLTPNQDQGASSGTLISASVSGKTGTQFSTRAGFQTFTPGAGVTATFDWIAIG